MAGEEDVELRDLVAQTLETKGVLGKIRAQLRSSVFLALEEHESEQKPHPLASTKLQQFLKTKDGQVATALVREFLEFFELDYTCAVFDPESNVLDTYPGREKLSRDLGIDSQTSTTTPLLASILQRSRHTHSPPPSSAVKHLKFPEQVTTHENNRTTNSMHPPVEHRSVYDETPLPLSTGKLHLRENDMALQNSTLQPVTNSLNTNENSNLHPPLETNLTFQRETLNVERPPQTVNGFGSENPELVDISVGSLQDTGVHAELGETFANNSAFDIEKLLNSTEDLDKVAKLAKVNTDTGGGRDELDDFFDTTIPSRIEDNVDPSGAESHISEELSVPLSSMATGKVETEDMTLSQHSLPDDFDYSEQVQS